MSKKWSGRPLKSALSKPWVGIRSRLPWLHINLVTAFLAAAVVGLFEDTIAQVYRARGLATRSRGSVGQYRRAGPRRDLCGD